MSTLELIIIIFIFALGAGIGLWGAKQYSSRKSLRFSLRCIKEFQPNEITKKLEIRLGGKLLTNLVVLELRVENTGNRDLTLQEEDRTTKTLKDVLDVQLKPQILYSDSDFEYIDCTTMNNDPTKFYISLGGSPGTTYVNIKYIKKNVSAVIHIYGTATTLDGKFSPNSIIGFKGAIADTHVEARDLLAQKK